MFGKNYHAMRQNAKRAAVVKGDRVNVSSRTLSPMSVALSRLLLGMTVLAG